MADIRAVFSDEERRHYYERGWWSARTLSDTVRDNADQSGERVAYRDDGGASLTWRQFDIAAAALAADLSAAGVRPGHRVAVWHRDSVAIHVLLVAVERCGAVAVGIGARAGPREVEAILVATRAVLVVTDGRRHESGRPPVAIAVLEGLRLAGIPTLGFGESSNRGPRRGLAPDEVFLINSTSGTTGLPKCVAHTQNRWYYFHVKAVANAGLLPDDVFLPAIPTPFGFGLWTSHTTPIHLAATAIRLARFDPRAALAAITEHRVSVLCCVSSQLRMLMAEPARHDHDLSSLRIVFTGGEAVPYRAAREFEELTGSTVLQFYGSNETGMLSATTLDDPPERRLRTAGRVVPEMRVRLYDGDTDVTVTGRGQPACRGPATSLGYLDGVDRDKLFTPDGRMRIGDLCEIDAEGYLTVTGRVSDLILRGGKNISAAEVEEAVGDHPAIAVAAAVAVPDPLLGERVCVYVETTPGAGISLAGLTEYLLARGVSKELLPERLVVVDELPRSSGGKIAKGELRDT